MTRQQLYADLPADLAEADQMLRRYGRWAMDRHKPQRCASAEGHYKAPPNDDDREPREVMLSVSDVERTRAALLAVPTVTRTVLLWLYVPSPEPVQARMRRCGVPPRVMRERHLEGVREFWAHWMRLQPCMKKPVAIRSVVLENACT